MTTTLVEDIVNLFKKETSEELPPPEGTGVREAREPEPRVEAEAVRKQAISEFGEPSEPHSEHRLWGSAPPHDKPKWF